MGIVTYVVKRNKPRTWAIGQKNIMAVKPGTEDNKYINYFKGKDSIFVEDYEDKKEVKPSNVPLFEFNASTNRTELSVRDTDKNLIKFLESHPDYNKKFEKSSPDIEANKKLAGFSKIQDTLTAIDNASESPKAAAVAVIGFDYYGKSEVECSAALKELAFKDPDKVINIINSKTFPSREVAALAFSTGIIKHSATATEIVWGHNDGLILSVATGENGLDKLTEKLSDGSQTGQVLLQEISEKVNKKAKAVKEAEVSKDDKIAELERKLAEAEAKNKRAAVPEPGVTLTLEEARKFFENKYSKEVPTRYINDLEWITNKNNAPVENNA